MDRLCDLPSASATNANLQYIDNMFNCNKDTYDMSS